MFAPPPRQAPPRPPAPITIAPAVVQFPGGSPAAFEQALIAGEFDPVQRELERQRELRSSGLMEEQAQHGVFSSAVSIEESGQLHDEFDRQLSFALSDITQRASAQRIGMEANIAMQNAQNVQQATMRSAELNAAAQAQFAAALLQFGAQEQNAYLTALNINAEAANAYRNNFVQLVGIEYQADIERSRLRGEAEAQLFSERMAERSIDLQDRELTEQSNLARFKAAAAVAPPAGPTTLPSTFSLGDPTAFASPTRQNEALRREFGRGPFVSTRAPEQPAGGSSGVPSRF